MSNSTIAQSPSIEEEQERLKKWRDIRKQASQVPAPYPATNVDHDRQARLDKFEAEKTQRIRDAENRRREEAAAIEARRMEKARAHLDALDDIDTARTNLINAQRRAKIVALRAFSVVVILPTLITAAVLLTAPPVFQSRSVIAIENTTPVPPENPLFNQVADGTQGNMAAAYQLRAQMPDFPQGTVELAIDATQGLITVSSNAASPEEAKLLNNKILKEAHHFAYPSTLKILSQPSLPERPTSQLFRKTLLAFFISLSIFAVGGTFIQSFRHYAHN